MAELKLRVSDERNLEVFNKILEGLRIARLHVEIITGEEVSAADIDEE